MTRNGEALTKMLDVKILKKKKTNSLTQMHVHMCCCCSLVWGFYCNSDYSVHISMLLCSCFFK